MTAPALPPLPHPAATPTPRPTVDERPWPLAAAFWGGALVDPDGLAATVLIIDPDIPEGQAARQAWRARPRPALSTVGGYPLPTPVPLPVAAGGTLGAATAVLALTLTPTGDAGGLAVWVLTGGGIGGAVGYHRSRRSNARARSLEPCRHRGLLGDAWALHDLTDHLRAERTVVVATARRVLWDATTAPQTSARRLETLRAVVEDLVAAQRWHEAVLAGGTPAPSAAGPVPAASPGPAAPAPTTEETLLGEETFAAILADLRLSTQARLAAAEEAAGDA